MTWVIRDSVHENLKQIVGHTAKASGASAELGACPGYPVTVNNPQMVEKILPSLRKVFGEKSVVDMRQITGAEDFSFFAEKVSGFFFFIGVTPSEINAKTAATNHSPMFYIVLGREMNRDEGKPGFKL